MQWYNQSHHARTRIQLRALRPQTISRTIILVLTHKYEVCQICESNELTRWLIARAKGIHIYTLRRRVLR